jgi:antitoxin PrlF
MMLKKVSAITGKGQVTIPKSVREALGVEYGGRVAFYVDENLDVSIRKELEDEDDPLIGGFLDFLADDMRRNPENIRDFPPALGERMVALTNGMTVDTDEEISGDVVI